MPKRYINTNKHKDDILSKFFKEFGINLTDKSVNLFIEFLENINKTETGKHQVAQFKNIIETWLKQSYQPDMFSTGGTINTLLTDSGTRLPDANTQDKLLQDAQEQTRQQVYVYDYAIDSSNHTLETQQRLLKKLGDVAFNDIKNIENLKLHLKKPGKFINVEQIPYYFNFPKPSGPGTVITHGTDTLDENSPMSAYLMLPKTLVWTASWASPEEKGSDAKDNIQKANLLASNSLTPIGVYVVIGNEIHLATRIKKINTHPWQPTKDTNYSLIKPWKKNQKDLSYFVSYGDNPVGYFNNNNDIFFNSNFLKTWEDILNKVFDSYFPLKKINNIKPAYVEHIIINKNTPRIIFNNLIKRLSEIKNPCAAIIEGDINLNPHYDDFIDTIHQLETTRKDIFIITTSHTKLNEAYKNLNSIPPSQLRSKLSALMGRDDVNNSNLILLLDYNLAGEVIEKEIVEQEHIYISKSFYNVGEFIIAFPGMTRHIIDDAINNLKNKLLTPEQQHILLINGYGDGHIPVGIISMEERLIIGMENKTICTKLIENIKNESIQKNKSPDFSVNNLINHLTEILIQEKSNQEPTQILREAFMKSNELLSSIGEAIDNNIKVLMGSKADFAIPNLDAYEIGTILKIIGVQALSMPTKAYLKTFKD